MHLPASLRTSSLVEGWQLARRLAEQALAERNRLAADMAAHLSAPPPPAVESLAATYFQAVAAVNHGWPVG